MVGSTGTYKISNADADEIFLFLQIRENESVEQYGQLEGVFASG